MKYNQNTRIRLLGGLSVLFSGFMIIRLFSIQVLDGDEFSEKADRQYSRPSADMYSRGSIFFQEKNGNLVSAASLKTNYIIAVNPMMLKEPEKIYDAINNILPINKDDFLSKAAKKDDPYEVIGKTGSKDISEKISGLDISGIFIYREKTRYYPAGRLAPHVVGFVGKTKENGDDTTGRYGLEKFYENVLKRDPDTLYINFFAEIFSNIKMTVLGEENSVSGDIILSIEPAAQNMLNKDLAVIKEKYDGNSVGGVIIEPKTGRIIAMGALPDFDSGNYGREKNIKVFSNPLIENVFEMGSTVKPLAMAAGIDAGAVTPETTYDDKGFIILNGLTISNYDGKARGITNMQNVLGNSLNVGMVFVEQKLGREKFAQYMKGYGLGERTGIDLPNEIGGLIKNLSSRYEVDYATAAFGQGIAITPIGVVRALSSLANGGILIRPFVVDSINYKIGATKKIEPEIRGRILKKETSEEITRMLVQVVDENLLGGVYKLKNYSVAAKTGTAQLTDGKGHYYDDKYLHSFFGYFPAYDPKFLIFLYIIDPKGVEYASHTLTEPFFNMTKFLISYYEIPPDR